MIDLPPHTATKILEWVAQGLIEPLDRDLDPRLRVATLFETTSIHIVMRDEVIGLQVQENTVRGHSLQALEEEVLQVHSLHIAPVGMRPVTALRLEETRKVSSLFKLNRILSA